MPGDSHKVLKEADEAKKYYNQAYMESLQVTQSQTKAMIQMQIRRKPVELTLN